MAAPTCYITIVKDMTYRGVPGEEWSNSYALTGATPADSTAWKALFDAIVAEEKGLYVPQHRVIKGYGYNKIPVKGDSAIYSVDLRPTTSTVNGTLNLGTGSKFAGDQAAWVRWGLDHFNSKGKRIYLRKYFHGGGTAAGGGDALESGYQALLEAFGTFMAGGTLLGSRKICDSDSRVPISHAASLQVTTRTLKRRGKRPPT